MDSIRKTIHSLKVGIDSAKKMTCRQVLGMLFGVCLVIFGNAGQLLAVNEWLTLFPDNASGPFTVLTITATSTTLFFGLCFFLWVTIKKLKVPYLWTRDCWLLATLIGFGNASNGVLVVCATPYTPEVLQAFLLSTTIFWTFLLMKVANKDDRSYFSPLVVISFFFSLAGIVVGAANEFSPSSSSGATPECGGANVTKFEILHGANVTVTYTQPPCTPPAPKWWIAVFSAGMLMVAIYNVFVFKFMTKYGDFSPVSSRPGTPCIPVSTSRQSFGGGSALGSATTRRSGSFARNMSFTEEQIRKRDFDNGITLKLAMLFSTGLTMTFFTWILAMVDALPSFGSSDSLHDVYQRIGVGYQCVFDASYCHNSNGLYAFLFCFCYVLNYFGTAYLNSYSAAVTSMVCQLSSPMVALILLIIPSWNVSKQAVSVPESLVAVFCLVLGAMLYTAWEESSRQEEENLEDDKQQGAGNGEFKERDNDDDDDGDRHTTVKIVATLQDETTPLNPLPLLQAAV